MDGKSIKWIQKKLFSRRSAGKEFSNSGYTLIELLVALVVFAFGILGVIGMQIFAIRGNAFAWNTTLAEKIAQQKIEYFKNISYNNIKAGTFFGASGTATGGYPNTVVTSDGYSLSLASILPVEDRIPTGGDNDPDNAHDDSGNLYLVDVEDYLQGGNTINSLGRGIRRGLDILNPGPPLLYRDDDANNILDVPFDNFRRITIVKVIDGGPPADPIDYCLVIKVLVYWRDSSGVEHHVSMMTFRALGA